jgi:hypothetical protein
MIAPATPKIPKIKWGFIITPSYNGCGIRGENVGSHRVTLAKPRFTFRSPGLWAIEWSTKSAESPEPIERAFAGTDSVVNIRASPSKIEKSHRTFSSNDDVLTALTTTLALGSYGRLHLNVRAQHIVKDADSLCIPPPRRPDSGGEFDICSRSSDNADRCGGRGGSDGNVGGGSKKPALGSSFLQRQAKITKGPRTNSTFRSASSKYILLRCFFGILLARYSVITIKDAPSGLSNTLSQPRCPAT